MAMNIQRHIKAHQDLYEHLARGETEKADTIRKFYDEYFAVMDLDADFYLETLRTVFQEHHLPQGRMTWRTPSGEVRPVRPEAVTDMGLLTIEGGKDDVCGKGQTMAAHDILSRIPNSRKMHHWQPDVGHYGEFSGEKWRRQIYPRVVFHILANN